MNLDFAEYLKGKKIDEKAFAKGDPNLYRQFRELFSQLHPESFTAQKLFLINQVRRRFQLSLATEEQVKQKPKPVKPKIGAKPKTAAKPVIKKQDGPAGTAENNKQQKTAKAKPKVKPVIRKK